MEENTSEEWFIVSYGDKIEAGPYKSEKIAKHESELLLWFNKSKHEIVSGKIDPKHKDYLL